MRFTRSIAKLLSSSEHSLFRILKTRSLPDSKPMEMVVQFVSLTRASKRSGHWRTVSARAAAQYGQGFRVWRGYFSKNSFSHAGVWEEIEWRGWNDTTPYQLPR